MPVRFRYLGCGATAGLLLVGLGSIHTPSGGARAAPQSSTLAAGGEWFTDQAEATGLDFVHINGSSGEFYISEIMGAGGALFDFDNDGDLDVYLVQGGRLGPAEDPTGTSRPTDAESREDHLYRNDLQVRRDGTRTLRFTDVTRGSGLEARSYGMGVAAGDINNDGWVDLYRTGLGANQLFRNNGDGTFTDATSNAGAGDARWSLSASFADVDRDGWLDLYVGNYIDHHPEARQPECFTRTGERDYCGPSAFASVPDRLYRNRGNGIFVDATTEAQVATEYGATLGVVAADLDADGWPDIYVANDGEPNQLWTNRHDGSFRNGALLAGAALNRDGRTEGSMGVDAGDFDGDGDDDLFMTHVTTETNTLYINDGTGLFEDRSTTTGLGAPSVAYTGFGTAWFDYDNDGWLDLLAVNGAVQANHQRYATNLLDAPAAAEPLGLNQRNQLFRNLGNGRFEEVSEHAGAVFELSEVSRGAAFGDVDNDGDVDVLVTNNNGPARLLVNNVGRRNRWLGLRLVGGVGPRDMLGARVGVFRDSGPALWRRARSDGSYASANDPRVLVGLGTATAVERVRVIWPSGREEEWADIPVNRWLTLEEGTGQNPE